MLEKTFNKAQHTFIVKIRVTSGICGTCLKTTKAVHSTQLTFILSGEKLKAFAETKNDYPIISYLICA